MGSDCKAQIKWEDPSSMASREDYIICDGKRNVKPYFFHFVAHVKQRWNGRPIAELFASEFRLRPISYYEEAIRVGRIQVDGKNVSPDYRVRTSQTMTHYVHRHEPAVDATPVLVVSEDEHMLAVSKPASIPVHPCGQFRKNTVVSILQAESGYKQLFPLHRLDRAVSGLLLLAKSAAAAEKFRKQLMGGLVHKQYIARVVGRFPPDKVEVSAPVLYHSCRGYSRVVTKEEEDEKETETDTSPNSHTNAKPDSTSHTTVEVAPASGGSPPVEPTSADGHCPALSAQASEQPSASPPDDGDTGKHGREDCKRTRDAQANELAGTEEAVLRHVRRDSKRKRQEKKRCKEEGSSTGGKRRVKDAQTGDVAKDACTVFELVRVCEGEGETHSIVKCSPITGRTHQIRVHLQHLGHPIANDGLYINGPPPFPATSTVQNQPDGSMQQNSELASDAENVKGTAPALAADGGRLEASCADIKEERERFCDPNIEQEQRTNLLEDVGVGGVDLDPMCTQCPRIAAESLDIQESIWLHCFCYYSVDWTFNCPPPPWASSNSHVV